MLRNDWLTSAPLPAHGQLFALALCRESTEKTLEERFGAAILGAARAARFEGKAVGANFREELEQFHREHKSAAFKAYVDALAKKLGDLPSSDGTAAQRFGMSSSKLPECVAKFQGKGAEAVRMAAEAAAEWAALSNGGRRKLSTTQEQYVEQRLSALLN